MPENKTKIDPTKQYKKSELEGEDEDNNETVSNRPELDREEQVKPGKTDDTADSRDDEDDDNKRDEDTEVTSRQPRID